MLDGLSTLAIVPKAKAIAARRLTKSASAVSLR